MESENLNRFFTSVNAELKAHEKFKALIGPKLAPDFNMFSCFCPDENRLSTVLGILLDPNGVHAQGDIFLNIFIDTIEKHLKLIDLLNIVRDKVKQSKTRVLLEAQTYSIINYQRRIDILLEIGDICIAIENKPWASDQENQIIDYIEHIKNIYKSYIFIYLSGSGENPGDVSIPSETKKVLEEEGQFLALNYMNLRNWLEKCSEKAKCDRVRTFIDEFQSYISLQFEGGLTNMERDLIVDHAVKIENIGAAFSVALSWPDIAKKMINKLAGIVKKNIEGKFGHFEMEFDFDYYQKESGFSFYRKDKWKIYKIKIGFDVTSTREFFCGIVKNNEQEPNEFETKLAEKLDINFKNKEYPNTWYVWWQNFAKPFDDWNASSEPWVGICQNGSTVNEVTSCLYKVIKCVDQYFDESILNS
jgi:hypothetical protein